MDLESINQSKNRTPETRTLSKLKQKAQILKELDPFLKENMPSESFRNLSLEISKKLHETYDSEIDKAIENLKKNDIVAVTNILDMHEGDKNNIFSTIFFYFKYFIFTF